MTSPPYSTICNRLRFVFPRMSRVHPQLPTPRGPRLQETRPAAIGSVPETGPGPAAGNLDPASPQSARSSGAPLAPRCSTCTGSATEPPPAVPAASKYSHTGRIIRGAGSAYAGTCSRQNSGTSPSSSGARTPSVTSLTCTTVPRRKFSMMPNGRGCPPPPPPRSPGARPRHRRASGMQFCPDMPSSRVVPGKCQCILLKSNTDRNMTGLPCSPEGGDGSGEHHPRPVQRRARQYRWPGSGRWPG